HRGGVECRVSGKVISKDRAVRRGGISFSCVIRPECPGMDHFPDVSVQIENGTYAASNLEGLVAGHYQRTMRAMELGARVDLLEGVHNSHRHDPQRGLLLVAAGKPVIVDFEL